MVFKSILGAVCACLAVVSFNVNAAIISTDWQTAGDNLITLDTNSGLEWLDLTVTNNINRDEVSVQLGVGGVFDGFRVATSGEVINLWENWSISLAAESPASLSYLDPGLPLAVEYLGNTHSDFAPWYGSLGYIDHGSEPHFRYLMGASYFENRDTTYRRYMDVEDFTSNVTPWAGTYLVRPSVVPIPAAVWLFSSGLIGLIGLARRKTNA